MKITEGLLSSSRVEAFSNMIDQWSESTLFKCMIFFALSIVFLLLMPVILIGIPFILAWDCASALVQRLSADFIDEPLVFVDSFWGNFKKDYSSWKESE